MKARRCSWAGDDPLMIAYHDEEWGVPERGGRALWEKLMLDGFQAGLAWITVLRKRDAFRKAFADFEPARVARFGERDVLRLLGDPGIIRSRAKIEATVSGARIYCDMAERGEDFATFCWSFTDGKVHRGNGRTFPARTDLSERASKELKRRGFKFVGPTIVHAWNAGRGHRPRPCARLLPSRAVGLRPAAIPLGTIVTPPVTPDGLTPAHFQSPLLTPSPGKHGVPSKSPIPADPWSRVRLPLGTPWIGLFWAGSASGRKRYPGATGEHHGVGQRRTSTSSQRR